MDRYSIALGKKPPKKILEEFETDIKDQKELVISLESTQENDVYTFLREFADFGFPYSSDISQLRELLHPTFYLDK